jgi:hypothetical protein
MPDGSTILTIGEAAEYARKLPKRVSDTALWQHAAGDLLMASEHAAFVFLARLSFYRAIYGDTRPTIGNPEGKKGHRWRTKRKLARDR